jgi:heme-degrading monooxygenase HmoA
VDPSVGYQAMASYLPLTRHRSVPGFLADALAIRRQLAKAEGLVGYSLDAELVSKTFWTFSVWKSRADLDAFARSDPHHRIIQRLRPRMGESRFAFFSLAGDALPVTREQMKAPLR